jgi:AraC-like DNA-binding protein
VNEEPHYTVKEVAAMLKLSPDTARRLFREEPGVLALGNAKRRGKRPYYTLRIPQSVLDRVYRQNVLG